MLIRKTNDDIMRYKCNNSIQILEKLTDEDFYLKDFYLLYNKLQVVLDGKEMINYTTESKKIRRANKDTFDYFNCYDNKEHFDFLLELFIEYEEVEIVIDFNRLQMKIIDEYNSNNYEIYTLGGDITNIRYNCMRVLKKYLNI